MLTKEFIENRIAEINSNIKSCNEQLIFHKNQFELLNAHISKLNGHNQEANHMLNELTNIEQNTQEPEQGENDATTEGNEPENDSEEHQDGTSSGQETEPSSGDCIQ